MKDLFENFTEFGGEELLELVDNYQPRHCYYFSFREYDDLYYQQVLQKQISFQEYERRTNDILSFVRELCKISSVGGYMCPFSAKIKKSYEARESKDYFEKMKALEKENKLNRYICFTEDEIKTTLIMAARGIGHTLYYFQELGIILIMFDLHGRLMFRTSEYIDEVLELAKKQGLTMENLLDYYVPEKPYQEVFTNFEGFYVPDFHDALYDREAMYSYRYCLIEDAFSQMNTSFSEYENGQTIITTFIRKLLGDNEELWVYIKPYFNPVRKSKMAKKKKEVYRKLKAWERQGRLNRGIQLPVEEVEFVLFLAINSIAEIIIYFRDEGTVLQLKGIPAFILYETLEDAERVDTIAQECGLITERYN